MSEVFKKSKPNIEFVSYDGEWPNLCSGSLVLKIDGEIVKFDKYILESTGSYQWSDPTEPETTQAPWFIRGANLPEELRPFRKEIIKVVNDNVQWGCCGGCI